MDQTLQIIVAINIISLQYISDTNRVSSRERVALTFSHAHCPNVRMAEYHRGDIVIVHLRVGLIVEDAVSQLATSRNSHYRGRWREGERERVNG